MGRVPTLVVEAAALEHLGAFWNGEEERKEGLKSGSEKLNFNWERSDGNGKEGCECGEWRFFNGKGYALDFFLISLTFATLEIPSIWDKLSIVRR